MEIYGCKPGESNENSHFHKTFHKPIEDKQYEKIRWALNEKSISKKRVDSINTDIKNGIKVLVSFFPNAPNNNPYYICELSEIKERNLGPLIAIDETNSERGWTNGTSSGHDDFKYDLKFSKIYPLNKYSFDGIKLKGQRTFFQLKLGNKNEDLLKKIQEEIKYIERYITPIICSF